jgi:hypothetical protein
VRYNLLFATIDKKPGYFSVYPAWISIIIALLPF